MRTEIRGKADIKYAVKNIFSNEEKNVGRQPEVDLAKAVLTFCLALVHCIIECTSEENLAYGIPFLFDSVIGGPLGAPMYMFAMGIGMAYARHRTARDYVRRAIHLSLTGFALNICRFLLPFLAGYLVTGDYTRYIEPLPYRIFGNDILQFASMAMLCMAFFVRIRIPRWAMLLIAFVMSVLGTCFRNVDVGIPICNIFLGYLIGIEDEAEMVYSDFPLLNWLIIPVCGCLFGELLRYVKSKANFYMIISSVGILAVLVYFPIGIKNRWGMFGEGQNCYYHLRTTDMLICLAAAVGILGIYYWLSCHLPGWVMSWVREISMNVNRIYCIHWVFVMIITNDILYIVRGSQELPVAWTMLLGASISVISILLAHFQTKRKTLHKKGI